MKNPCNTLSGTPGRLALVVFGLGVVAGLMGCSPETSYRPEEGVSVHFPGGKTKVIPVFDADGIPIVWAVVAPPPTPPDRRRGSGGLKSNFLAITGD